MNPSFQSLQATTVHGLDFASCLNGFILNTLHNPAYLRT